MSESIARESWLTTIADAARAKGVPLPAFVARGMGSARTENLPNGRFVTFKRRLVKRAQAEIDGVEWTLWLEMENIPRPVAAFRESHEPTKENVAAVLTLLEGWLIQDWTPDEVKAAVAAHPRAQSVDYMLVSSKK